VSIWFAVKVRGDAFGQFDSVVDVVYIMPKNSGGCLDVSRSEGVRTAAYLDPKRALREIHDLVRAQPILKSANERFSIL